MKAQTSGADTPGDFALRLETEFQRRKTSNSKYSLRAFAKFLELDPSYLSKLLKGKRPLSSAIEKHCSKLLGWSLEPNLAETLTRLKDSYSTLDLDAFLLISEWYHYAIFELIKIKSTQWNADSVASALSISKEQAQDALTRLQRLGLIRKSGLSFNRTHKGVTTLGNKFTTTAFRALQKEILNRAISAMENIPMEMRDQTSMTLAIPSQQIPKAKKMLTRFRRQFCSSMQNAGNLDSVYHLSLSFYPVSSKIEPRSSK